MPSKRPAAAFATPLESGEEVCVVAPADADSGMEMGPSLARDPLEDRIPAYEAKLRKLASELSRAEDHERRRLAVTLHDRVGQTLALAQMRLESMRSPALPDEVARGIGDVLALIEQAVLSTRCLTAELSPPVLYEVGLSAAVQWWAEQLRKQHGTVIAVRDETSSPIDEEIRVLLFQAVRELLLNVVKHARSRAVEVVISCNELTLSVEVHDNGVGFDDRALARSDGFGLFSLRERLDAAGGSLCIHSSPGSGTRVVVTVPREPLPSDKRGAAFGS